MIIAIQSPTPQLSGLLITPVAVGVLLVKPISIHILRFLGYKTLLLTNIGLISLSLCSFAFITSATPAYLIAFLTFLYGFLIALQYTGMNSLAYAKIDDSNVSDATSIMSTIQQIAQSFGVAISAILITAYSFSFFQKNNLTVAVFHHTFISLGVLTLISGAIFLKLNKEDGNELVQV